MVHRTGTINVLQDKGCCSSSEEEAVQLSHFVQFHGLPASAAATSAATAATAATATLPAHGLHVLEVDAELVQFFVAKQTASVLGCRYVPKDEKKKEEVCQNGETL